MNLSFGKYGRTIPKWVPWFILISIALLIIIFNDALGKNENFVILGGLFFLFLTIIVIYWLFKQIAFILKLKNEKAKTELLHLKSQVNPHFFFNTLNNLYGLMEKDSNARKMVLKLSDMMRYSIYEGQKDRVTLGEEVDYLNNYIELQELRYHRKSDVQFNHHMENANTKIMPLLFIILVENAFKHGLENLGEKAYIHISLAEHENKVNFEIENNFELQEKHKNRGIGLENLKRRLELVYPNKHSLTFKVDADIYKVKLSLDLK
jgi:LytS/YehU family sensor histidine kinase